jgi:hypothetical protein
MELRVDLGPTDKTQLLAFIQRASARTEIAKRQDYLAKRRALGVSKTTIWHAMTVCLLTSRQRSTRNGRVYKFLDLDDMPLSWFHVGKYKDDAELRSYVENTIFNAGLRMNKRISGFVVQNREWLVNNDGFGQLTNKLTTLAEMAETDPLRGKTERKLAQELDFALAGIGPKQGRNFLLNMGLARDDIPLDSRVLAWLSEKLPPSENGMELPQSMLADEGAYSMLMDAIQALCDGQQIELKEGAEPTLLRPIYLDAVMFDDE